MTKSVTFDQPLKAAAQPFVSAGGARDALTLVRAQKFAITGEQLAEIEVQRQYCTIQIVPAIFGKPNQSLLPMREWMAEHCDLVVAIGGKHWHVSKERAGVPEELEESLSRGKPGFVVGGFGGATAGYVKDHDPCSPGCGMDFLHQKIGQSRRALMSMTWSTE